MTREYTWSQNGKIVGPNLIDSIYNKIVFWPKNLFLLPSGACGKRYIKEITRLLNEWVSDSPLKDISFKAIVIMPNLLLQKPSKTSKSKEHQLPLERRLDLWQNSELEELLFKGETIQKLLTSVQKPSTIAKISRKFKQLMQKGDISAALNLLTNKMGHGILPLDQKTISQLVLKHPQKSCAEDILINGTIEKVHPVRFESINEELIRRAAIKLKGDSGPSGMDADGWQRILASNSFGTANSDLQKAFANVVKKLCTDLIETQTIEAFLFCSLIPLEKSPGLRPIGVGEVLRRIAGKVIVSVLKNDVINCTGSLQVCAGHEAGIEAAVHVLNSFYNDENNDAVLLVDAGNAFN